MAAWETAHGAVVKRSYFMGLSRACPWFGKDMSSLSWVPPVFWTGKYAETINQHQICPHLCSWCLAEEKYICSPACRTVYDC